MSYTNPFGEPNELPAFPQILDEERRAEGRVPPLTLLGRPGAPECPGAGDSNPLERGLGPRYRIASLLPDAQ